MRGTLVELRQQQHSCASLFFRALTSAIGSCLCRCAAQTFLLPEELLLVTFEGLAASYIRSPAHSAAACSVQELQAGYHLCHAALLPGYAY